jgi:sulfate permease, SulP family
MKLFGKEYTRDVLQADIIAGLIVAIVALPLAIGFAIASGVDPSMGIYAAIVGGLVAALFGGSEYNISGPTGAMVVVILSVVASHGIEGLILATLLAGIILLLLAFLKLGKIIEYIPSPVIVGFTAGIATIIFFGQLNNFLGISPAYPADAGFITKLFISFAHVLEANIAAAVLAALTILILVLSRKYLRRIPGSLLAVVITMGLVFLFPAFFHVRVVADVGTIPHTLPIPHLPQWSWELIRALLPAALTIAALAAIESLLSAVVADGMTDTRHKPNKELFGIGLANVGSSLFGGLPITGAIARTATNVRNGGRTRMAAIFHAVFLFIAVFFVAALASKIPLATLAGILMFVAFNMVEWERVFLIFRTPLSDVAVMITTFLLTVLVDLTVAIEVGLILAAILFMKRMSDLYNVQELEAKPKEHSIAYEFDHKDISIYTISGPLFFGAASRIDQALGETPGGHKKIKVIRMRNVPVIDATGLNFLEGTVHKHKKMGGIVLFSGVQPNVMSVIRSAGIEQRIGADHFFGTTRQALAYAIRYSATQQGVPQQDIEAELAKYNLIAVEAEDSAAHISVRDHDPVKEILDSVGVTTMAELGQETVEKTVRETRRVRKSVTRGVRAVGKAAVESVSGKPTKKKRRKA